MQPLNSDLPGQCFSQVIRANRIGCECIYTESENADLSENTQVAQRRCRSREFEGGHWTRQGC